MREMLKPVKKLMDASGQEYPNAETAKLYRNLINEEFRELVEAEVVSDEVAQLDAVIDLLWVILGYALAKGYLIRSAWGEVARSNLSKIDSETGTCIKRDDGKIMKPATYSPPSLEAFVK